MWTVMNEGVLSQQEINTLLRKSEEVEKDALLTDAEKDMLGEVGNISMSTAATALSQILNEKVEITTPQVTVTTLLEVQNAMTIPNVVFQVKFMSGLAGSNVLLMNVPDASVIASLMMGGDGKNPGNTLTELEISAVSEAMNQMIGSASTSMATMLDRNIDITPPSTQIWETGANIEMDGAGQDQPMVKVAFRLTVENLLDSQIMQIFNLETVKDIAGSLLGEPEDKPEPDSVETDGREDFRESDPGRSTASDISSQVPGRINRQAGAQEPQSRVKRNQAPQGQQQTVPEEDPAGSIRQPVTVRKPSFGELQDKPVQDSPRNLELIMDVPLEFSVILGKTKRTIRDVLSLSPGSVVELDKLAEEPLEVYVNGKLIANGEVVVINESFGIRITNIISATERVKNLR